MGKKIIDCVVCGKRILPSRYKIGTCDYKCQKELTPELRDIIKKELGKGIYKKSNGKNKTTPRYSNQKQRV